MTTPTDDSWKKKLRDVYKKEILAANHEVDADVALYKALDAAYEAGLREAQPKMDELLRDLNVAFSKGEASAKEVVLKLLEQGAPMERIRAYLTAGLQLKDGGV